MSVNKECNFKNVQSVSLCFLGSNSGHVNFIMSVLCHSIKTFDSVPLAKWHKFKSISRSGGLKAHAVTYKYYHALRMIAAKKSQGLSSSILILIQSNHSVLSPSLQFLTGGT